MKRKVYISVALVLILVIAMVACGKKAKEEDLESRAFQTKCYNTDGGDTRECASGGKFVVGAGAALLVTPGATVQVPQIQVGSNYPVEYATTGEILYVGITATFTGTTSIVSTTHGMTTAVDAVVCTIVSPDDDAGDPYLCYATITDADVTLNAAQDDGTAATLPGTAHYMIVGN
jgi:uncharacterized membrane protein YfcA